MFILISYFRIIRPLNAILAGSGVALGFWISGQNMPLKDLGLLIATAICAVGFGNIINDIKDSASDKINHPKRPIPKGEIGSLHALILAFILGILSLVASFSVSISHFIATLIPLTILWFYNKYLKATPLLGNIVVSILVAYTLIFGSIGSRYLHILIVPAFLAFLLNLSREILKDLQDRRGDLQAGITTTASLSNKVLKSLIILISLLYIPIMPLPFYLKHFGWIYLFICIIILFPLHLYWLFTFIKKSGMEKLEKISSSIKLEMLYGLAALALDRLFYNIWL